MFRQDLPQYDLPDLRGRLDNQDIFLAFICNHLEKPGGRPASPDGMLSR